MKKESGNERGAVKGIGEIVHRTVLIVGRSTTEIDTTRCGAILVENLGGGKTDVTTGGIDPEITDPEITDLEIIDPEIIELEIIDPEIIELEIIDLEIIAEHVVQVDVKTMGRMPDLKEKGIGASADRDASLSVDQDAILDVIDCGIGDGFGLPLMCQECMRLRVNSGYDLLKLISVI